MLAGHCCWQRECHMAAGVRKGCRRLMPCGLQPYQGGQGKPVLGVAMTCASSHHATFHPSCSHSARFTILHWRRSLSSSDLKAELQWWSRSSIPGVENCFTFPWRRMGRETASLLFLSGALPHWDIGLGGGWALLILSRGFTWLQDWTNHNTTGTSGGPSVALETHPQRAFSRGSTTQGKEGGGGLQHQEDPSSAFLQGCEQ